jgi:hypothetical protein
MGAPKHMPSLLQRPGFPKGLHVLLVDPDTEARARTEAQLRDCSYEVRRRMPRGMRLLAASGWRGGGRPGEM